MTQRIRSRVQAAKMRYLRAVKGITRRDRVRNVAVREELRIGELHLRVERSQLQIQDLPLERFWIDHEHLPYVEDDRQAMAGNLDVLTLRSRLV